VLFLSKDYSNRQQKRLPLSPPTVNRLLADYSARERKHRLCNHYYCFEAIQLLPVSENRSTNIWRRSITQMAML